MPPRFDHLQRLARCELQWRNTKVIAVSEEKNTLALSDSSLRWLNPLAPSSAVPQALEEAERSTLNVRAVVLAHNWLDSLGSLISVVKWDGRDVVVKNVGLDNAVKEGTANETEFTIDRSSRTTNVVPALAGVVRKSWVSVLEEGDGNEPVVDP